MKNFIALSLLVVFGGLLIISRPIRAQETIKKEKTVKIKTITDENGKKTVSDTTFVISDDMSPEELEKLGIVTDGDNIRMDVEVETDGKSKNKKIVIIKGGKGKTHTEVINWTDEMGEEVSLQINEEIEKAMADIEKAQHDLEYEMEVLDGERIIVLKHLDEIEDIAELEEIEALKQFDELRDFNYEIIELPEPPKAPKYPSMFYFDENHGKVTDVELRDAGIKNKQNRLDADEIEIEVENGIVKFYFTLKQEGNPKITVFNVYGDKVFSAKPDKMNNKYSQQIDLSMKQHGTYYIQVVMGDSSFTEKVKL